MSYAQYLHVPPPKPVPARVRWLPRIAVAICASVLIGAAMWAAPQVFAPVEVSHSEDGVNGGVPIPGVQQPGPQLQGDRFWSSTGCWGGSPVWSYYYGVPNQGAYYASVYAWQGDVVWHSIARQYLNYHYTSGVLHDLYRRHHYECGWFGVIVSDMYLGSNYVIQYTVHPQDPCSLRALIRYSNGQEGGAYWNQWLCRY